MNLKKIYVCHWKKLKDRKKEVIEILDEENILEYEFNEKYDKDDWNIDELKKLYPYAFEKTPSGRYLNDSEISLLLKHYDIIRELSNTDIEYALVLEDDVILCDNFLDYLKRCFDELPKDWDLVWVGSCCNLHEPKIDDRLVYKTERGSRCTHAYLISKTCANKILDNIDQITEAADYAFNFFIKKLNLNNYWVEPPLAIQNPNYKTTIQIGK